MNLSVLARHRLYRQNALWVFWLFIMVLCVLFQPLVDSFYLPSKWSQLTMTNSYRLISAHFVHINWQHASVNLVMLAGIPIVFSTVWQRQTVGVVASILVGCAIGISVSLLSRHTLTRLNVSGYVGLSGVLHGLYFYYALTSIRLGYEALTQAPSPIQYPNSDGSIDKDDQFCGASSEQLTPAVARYEIAQGSVIACVILGKIIYEQYHRVGTVNDPTNNWLHSPIVYQAHTDGVIIATLLITLNYLQKQLRQ